MKSTSCQITGCLLLTHIYPSVSLYCSVNLYIFNGLNRSFYIYKYFVKLAWLNRHIYMFGVKHLFFCMDCCITNELEMLKVSIHFRKYIFCVSISLENIFFSLCVSVSITHLWMSLNMFFKPPSIVQLFSVADSCLQRSFTIKFTVYA